VNAIHRVTKQREDELFVASFTMSNNRISPINSVPPPNLFGASEEVQKPAAQLLKWVFKEMERRPAVLRREVGHRTIWKYTTINFVPSAFWSKPIRFSLWRNNIRDKKCVIFLYRFYSEHFSLRRIYSELQAKYTHQLKYVLMLSLHYFRQILK
jgi:hypothetical protein